MHRMAVLCLSVGALIWSWPVLADRTDNPNPAQNKSGVSGTPIKSREAAPPPSSETPPKQDGKPDPKPAASVGASAKAADKPSTDAAPAEPGKAVSKDDPAPAKTPKGMAGKSDSPSGDALADAEGKGTRDRPDKSSGRSADGSRKEIVVRLQKELRRVGCYEGEIDGAWGPASSDALGAFGARRGLDARDLSPSETWLKRVTAAGKRVCRPDGHARYRTRLYRDDDFNDDFYDDHWYDY